MFYRLLGELEVAESGRLIGLPGGPALILLAVLLMNANRRMPKADLIRAAWGGDDISEAQLHKRVMEVRDALAPAGRRDDIKTHARYGYEMQVATDDVDVLVFLGMVREADEARSARRFEDEIAVLTRALRLWRGPHPLANVPGEALRQDILALEQRHKRAAARLFDLELARGHHERILDQVATAAGFHPSDRRLCEQLMVASYRCGHLTDVAAAYERHRQALEQETEAKPDALLRALHFAVARGDDAGAAAAESAISQRAGAPAVPAVIVPRELPRPVELVGRDELVADAVRRLRSDSLAVQALVISGAGGIGKTALALRVGHLVRDRFPDGQLFAELRGTVGPAVDTTEVLAHFLRVLGVSRVPQAKEERLAEYRTLLADRRVLVVLDDAVDGAQLNDLMPASPGCAVLVTARRRLPEVSDAWHLRPLEPLSHADAAELFRRVVRAAGVSSGDDPAGVDHVVALCGGMPLAVRIAAALRVENASRPIGELADRLVRQGLAGFEYGKLNLARTIGAGFERLGSDGRQLFLELGLLPLVTFGPWTAAALLDGTSPDSALAALAQLAAPFMIEWIEPEMRYRFHDLTREYANRRALAEHPAGRQAVAARAYRALLTLARHAHASLYGGDFEVVHSLVPDWDAPAQVLAEIDADALAWFETERLNIRAVVQDCADLGLVEMCWDLAVSAHEFYTVRGYFDDWQATHIAALRACRKAGDRRGEGIVLACLSQPALLASRRTGAGTGLAEMRRAVELLAECQDGHGQAIALRTLANALRRSGHLSLPLALFGQALEHYTASGDIVGRYQALRFIGQNHLDIGDFDAARGALEAALALAAELGDDRLIAMAQYWVGQARLAVGDVGGARQAFDEALRLCGDVGGVGHAYARHGLGDVARERGDYAAAERHLAASLELVRDGADSGLAGRAWLSVAALRQAQGQSDGQAAALRQAIAQFTGCGAAYLELRAQDALARLMAGRGDVQAAEAARTRVREIYDLADVPEHDRVRF